MSRAIRGSLRLYGVLLKLYPAGLRHRYAAEMVDVFEEQLNAASRERGVPGLIRVWCCVMAEVIEGPAVFDLSRRVRVPAVALLSSTSLFLFFFWVSGMAPRCR